MHRTVARGHALALLGLGLGGLAACTEPNTAVDVGGLVRIVPLSVSSDDAWRLFDRSVSSALSPDGAVQVSFEARADLAGIKVYGPAPYRLDVRTLGGASLGIDAIDLSRLELGWHAYTPSTFIATTEVELRFEPLGGTGGVPEF